MRPSYRKPTNPALIRRVALALWLGAVALLTMTPQPILFPPGSIPAMCLICGDRGLSDGLLNLVLFLPLGLLLRSAGVGALGATATGVLLSAGIELAQQFLPGRFATVGDVFWNGAGAAVGALVWSKREYWLDPAPEILGRLSWLSTGVMVAVVALSGLLFAPQGTDGHYYGQWTPDLGFMDHYDGELLDARLDGVAIPSGRYPDDLDPAAALQGDWAIETLVVTGSAPRRVAPIVSIFDDRQREVFVLGAHVRDLVWRERIRAQSLHLDQPDLRVTEAFRGHDAGDTLVVVARRVGAARCLQVGSRISCGLGFTPGRAWSLLMYPENLPQGARKGLDALWLGILFAPVGYLSRTRRDLAAKATAGLALLCATALLGRLLLSPWSELLGAVAGLGLGFAARSPARRVLARFHPINQDSGDSVS